MGSVKTDDVAPGWIDVWRLWRHCLCRFGWYPLFVAPLVTCACLLDLYSSTGCDFIRMDIGFVPANDVWSDSYAQLGLFSFDSHEPDFNKWKRTFNAGCQMYSMSFENVFIKSDQTWYVSRIMAYISGISSLVALATAWLLTITPLPASFFWPGLLLPAVVLSMLTGAAKFLFFDTQICTEPLWFVDASSAAVPALSCEIGESSVFGIASVAAFFFCTVLICFRSPQKRTLDENFGRRPPEPGSTITHHTGTDIIVNDPENGNGNGNGEVANAAAAVSGGRGTLGIEKNEAMTIQDSQQTKKAKNTTTRPQIIEHGNHTRSTSDVTWSTGQGLSTALSTGDARVALSPRAKPPEKERPPSPEVEWNAYGRPIVVTINDSSHDEPRGLSYSDGSTTQSSSKSPGLMPNNNPALPPRHNGKKSNRMRPSFVGSKNSGSNNNNSKHSNRSDYDTGSVASRISKISFAETHASDDMSALGMQSYSASSSNRSKPSVVAIPTSRRSRHTFSSGSSTQTSGAGKKLRHKNSRGTTASVQAEGRDDVFSNEHPPHHHGHPPSVGGGPGGRMDNKPQILEYLPPLDEISDKRSLEDHGDLINKCVRDLQRSFDDNGFSTM